MLYYASKDLQQYVKTQGLPSSREVLNKLEAEGIISTPKHLLSFHRTEMDGHIATKFMRVYSWDEIEKIAVQLRERKQIEDPATRPEPILFYSFKDVQNALKQQQLAYSRPMLNAWESAGIIPMPDYLKFHKGNVGISKEDIRLYSQELIQEIVEKVRLHQASSRANLIDR